MNGLMADLMVERLRTLQVATDLGFEIDFGLMGSGIFEPNRMLVFGKI